MDKELHTIDMQARPVVLGNVYLNVPGDNYLKFGRNIIAAVENIGVQHGTVSGSNFKKGIHYIQKETQCPSKRQIKMMLRNVQNAMIHNPDDSSYIYRCSKKYYAQIFKFIVNTASIDKPDGVSYSEYLIPEAKMGLWYVSQNGINNQVRNTALNIYNSINY